MKFLPIKAAPLTSSVQPFVGCFFYKVEELIDVSIITNDAVVIIVPSQFHFYLSQYLRFGQMPVAFTPVGELFDFAAEFLSRSSPFYDRLVVS